MPVLVSELLAEPSLRLNALTPHRHADTRAITWVATTELSDPTPFLRGGELVCTTALQKRTDEQWRALVDSLASLPVAALCIGTGLVRESAPPALVAAAEGAGLIVLDSPVSVPFIQISRWVADRIFAERYELIRSSSRAQDELLRQLLAGRSLPQLLKTLRRHLEPSAEVALVDADNRVIASYPSDPNRSPVQASSDGQGIPRPPDASGPAEVPIIVDGEPLAYLRCVASAQRPDILASAANILGLEIARRQAVLAGKRALAGQVLEDVIQRSGSEADARRRLAELGLDCSQPHRVIVGHAKQATASLQRDPMAILRLFDSAQRTHVTATIDDDVLILLAGQADVSTVATRLLERLHARDPRAAVAIGSAHADVRGIRSSYLEARQGLRHGPGVHECSELSVSDVLLSSSGAGLDQVTESLLRPLVEHDREYGSALVATLSAWLDSDCSAATTCAALHLHRNSLRYRLAQIGRLTAKDLNSLPDRFELWFALQHSVARPQEGGAWSG